MSFSALESGGALLRLMLSPEVALWPAPMLWRIYLPLSWAAVLCATAGWLLRARAPRWRAAVLVGLALLCAWPGPVSPSHWLGLAFQSPSLMSVALALACIRAQFQPVPRPGAPQTLPAAAPTWLLAAAVLLGWCLLLDTLALWPLELYRTGRTPAIIWLLALGCAWVWLRSAPAAPARRWLGLLGGVLVLHVLTRLPTGNCWDAWLDPGLWLLAHWALGRRAWARWQLSRARA